ncbi:TMV resistance protein N-like, partial [Trifolium medium]|nr:TMV resistance protein N-like [Trifolium medium]
MALQYSFTYDVFISFRGEDTRYGFTSHLNAALNQRGIHTFTGDVEGEEIMLSLLKAIEVSRIAIIIFSKNYAFSRWCLDELTGILDCYENSKIKVLPVFYDVDPSDVRHGTGSYGEALAKHEEGLHEEDDKERLNKWRTSLHKAASLNGYYFR